MLLEVQKFRGKYVGFSDFRTPILGQVRANLKHSCLTVYQQFIAYKIFKYKNYTR